MDSYIICATPRSGSTLLCELMAMTEVAGAPDSYFMRDIDPVWAKQLGLPDARAASNSAEYLAAVLKAGRGETGVFGLRLMQESLADLLALLAPLFPDAQNDRDLMAAAFSDVLYIYLRRDDTVAQAISLVKARQTGLWHIASDGSPFEQFEPVQELRYDFGSIAEQVAQLQHEDRAWAAWFKSQGIQPISIGYDDLAANPQAKVRQICAALGVTIPDFVDLQPNVAKLADAVSLEWIGRFCREAGLDMKTPT